MKQIDLKETKDRKTVLISILIDTYNKGKVIESKITYRLVLSEKQAKELKEKL